MTQQQFAPQQVPQQVPQYPQAPQPGYGQPAPQYPQQPYPQQVPQQQFPQGYGQPQPPQQPLAQGTLDDFYNQPTSGGGPGISWSDKAGNKRPLGTTYVGVVARDVTHGDVQQQTDFNTKQPLFYRDGRPKFAMKVPLRSVLIGMPDQSGQVQLQPSQEFPDGEASWFVRGQTRDELTRAMSAAGCIGSPREGAMVQVTLVNRRASSAGFQPANVVQITYTPGPNDRPGEQAPQTAPAEQAQAPTQTAQVPVPVPASAPVAQQPAQPVPDQSFAQQQVQAYTQPPQAQPVQQQQQQGPPPTWAQPETVPIQQQPPMAPPVQQQMPPQAPVQPPVQPPADLNDEQRALLARLTNQGQ